MHGHTDIMVTLRGTEDAEVLDRLECILLRFPVPTPAVSPQAHGEEFCALHNVPMRLNKAKNGGKDWYSHKVDGTWCRGKHKK